MSRILPFLGWLKNYSKAALRADLVSGVTVALVLIPQSMAYAQLAGLPSYYGLYASFLPPMVASLFGSSRQLATGPVAVVSLMTAASLEPLATAGSEGYIAFAILLALTVGVFQLALGLLRLGMVVNFLSHPVVNGFTNAAAIIIATSQLSKLFGVQVDKADHHYETVIRVGVAAFHYTHWPTLGMGVLALAIMYGLKRTNPKVPYVLVAVVATAAISWATGFEKKHHAPLPSIDCPEAHERIHSFNDATMQLDKLGAERTEISRRLAELKRIEDQDSLEVLQVEYELAAVNTHIRRLKDSACSHREALRSLHFEATTAEDGTLRFCPIHGAVPNDRSDGRTWRLEVGNRPLDDGSVTLTSGGAVVGQIPPGLPALALPDFSTQDFLALLPSAVIISFLGFMEAISIAKAMAARTGQVLDPNQELIGQGLANILGSVGQSYPTSGSFSRSAVNLQSGAQTGLSCVFASAAVAVVLLLFTPWLYHLPQATLAAIIMMAVIGLVSVSSFIQSWQTHRVDGATQLITFVCTLAFAPHLDRGIMIGVALSLGVYVFKGMKPNVAHLSLHPDGSFRDAESWNLAECRHISMIRFDAPLFFANASFFEELVSERITTVPELRHIVLVATGINDMDASGADVLSLTVDNVRAAGIGFSMCSIKENVLALMKRTHLYEKIGEENVFPTQPTAIRSIWDAAHKGSDERECPLLIVCLLAECGED
ncbi:MAG TPA: SulP family inorganic anion transporter [Thermoguttaceae bacterium]|nr:SulP family inorganic anion transporter [Thermoguttaceae bacterium]